MGIESLTASADHHNGVRDFIRPLLTALLFPYPLDKNGADKRSYGLLTRTFKEYEGWIRSGTHPVGEIIHQYLPGDIPDTIEFCSLCDV